MVGKGSVNHNSREFNAKNTDPQRTHLNTEYCNIDIKEVYHYLFDDALETYNEKQKRADRRIENYYEKIRTGRQEKLFHEIIIQIGNCDDTNAKTPEGELAERILDEYYRDFQKRNPYLYVFSAHLHMDEATPHLHIDFVPFTTESKRGLDTRVSLKQALANQGFIGKSRQETEWNLWVESEKEALEEVMKCHSVHWEKKGTHEKHLSVYDYEKKMRKQEVEELTQQTEELNVKVEELTAKYETLTKYEVDIDELTEDFYEKDEFKLPEPPPLMTARTYKTKFIEPLFNKLITLFSTCSVVMPVFAENVVADSVETQERMNPEIISEFTEKREENIKHFMLSDGSFVVAQYNNPVHYQDDSGEWIDIDNTITKTEATSEQVELFGTDEIYATNNAVDNVVFAEKSNSNTLVAYEAQDYPISLNYQSAKKSNINVIENDVELTGDDAFLTLPNVTQEILYENVFDGVDLQYIVSPNKLKENIILKDQNAQNSFTVNYNIGELTAQAVDEHTINLMDGNEIVYTISAPYMIDSNGEKSEAVTLDVYKNKNGKLRVNIVADSSWLQAEERAYPVTVDPAITEETYSSIKGVSGNGGLISENPITLSGINSYALLDVGSVTSDAFIDHVVSAELHLPVVSNTSSAATRIYLRKVTENWRGENNTVTKVNPKVDSVVVDYENVETTATKLNFDITKLYLGWENGEANNGIKLELVKDGNLTFAVSNDTEPVLTVNYMSTSGLDMTMPMTTFDMGSAGYVYVNNYSGNLVITRENEISSTGEEYPYNLSMTYNSLSSATDADYSRWLPSYMSGFNIMYIYIAPDGTQKYIKRKAVENSEDLYELENNDYGWEHLKVTSSQTITIPFFNKIIKIPLAFDVWKNNTTEKHSFDAAGLQKIVTAENLNTDNATVRTIFSREPIADSDDFYIVDGDGQKLLVQNTESSYTVTQYSCVSDSNYSAGERVTYVYDTDGNVTQIKRGDKVEATFTYTDGRIETITDDNNHKLTFTYDGNSKRIKSVTESKNGVNGQTFSFERSINKVTTRTAGAKGVYGDNDDTLVTSCFSPDLKLLGESYSTVSGEYLGAVSYDRDENESVTSVFDDIKRVGVVGKTPNNLLKNHNIESTDKWTVKAIADNNAVYTASLSSEKSYVGTKSFKVTTTDFTKGGAAGYCQTITPDMGLLQTDKTYVASAYINAGAFTKDADAMSNTSCGAFVMAEVKTQSGTERYYSNCVTSTGDKWERSFLTFEVPETGFTEITIALIGRNGAGTAYFDAVQLEEGDYPGQYNMLENNSFYFANPHGEAEIWERRNLADADVVENGQMKITGSPDKRGAVYQSVELANASPSDTYTLSCWAKADAVSGRIATRHYSVSVLVTYADSTTEIVHASKFNNYDSDTQYISGSFKLEHPDNPELIPTKVGLLIAFYRQCNTAFFDDVALFRSADVYDLSDGALQQSSEPTETYEYYTDGSIKKRTVSENGVVTVYNYAENGKLTDKSVTETITQEDGSTTSTTTSYTYNSNGDILTYTNEEGVVYTYTYNSYGDVVSVLNSENKGDVFEYEVYDTDKTRVTKETYEDGTVYEYTYHSGEAIKTETVKEDDTICTYTYDEKGNLVGETEGTVNENEEVTIHSNVVYEYDVTSGTLIKKTTTVDGETTIEQYNYNQQGKLISCTVDNEVKESYTYYDNGNIKSESKNGNELTTNYDIEGRVTAVEHNGFAYKYKYDDFGNTEDVSVGMVDDIECENDIYLIKYEYYSDKTKLKKITYGNNDTEEYTYNAFGNIVQKNVSGLGSAYYRYDNMGRLTYEKDYISDRRTYHNYDLEGRLESTQVLDNSKLNTYEAFLFSSANVYDDESRIIRKDMKGKQYALDTYYYYNNDERGLLSSVATTIGGSRRLNYTYNYDEQVTSKSMTLTTPYVNTYTYNDEGLIATDTVTAKNGTFAYGYTYDDNGNITSITKNGTVQQNYAYDENSQLVREDNRDINKSIVYSYDGFGNILNKKEYAFTTGDLGAVTDTITYSYDSVWKDKLTSYDGQSITYDSMGNPLSYRGATLDWNGRRLMLYNKDGTSIAYEYDSNGLRTSKTVNGVRQEYYYDENGQLLYEIKQGVYELYYKYDADGNLFSITRYRYSDGAKHVFYAITNTRGDVIELRENSGAIYATYTYDSWGRCVSVKNSSGAACSVNTVAVQSSIRYRGYVYDYETGIYYLQSRYYDPEVGRFLNADDVDFIGYSGEVLSYNAFAYCENEPVNGEDETGCASSKKKKTKYYITVYTYNLVGKWDVGHIDFSLDNKIYSYGTVNNDGNPDLDNTVWNKLQGKVPGYVMTSNVKTWQNYLKKANKIVQAKVRINLNKSEYKKLKRYIENFFKKTKYSFTAKDIEYYKVQKGSYKYYSFTKANCSTFVRDALYACIPKYVNAQVPRISYNGYKSIYMPDNVFALAKLIGVTK